MEIRCDFCGWDNPDSAEICEKCHKPLQKGNFGKESARNMTEDDKATRRQHSNNVSILKETIKESMVNNPLKNINKECPECGYDLENGMCSNCGYSETLKYENAEKSQQDSLDNIKTTRRPDRKNRKEDKKTRFVLTPISESGEAEGDLIDFSGNVISLNRANTAPENSTITSQVQAVITHEDDKWYIEDRSELKTTLVRAARKIELQNGDWILLGNQLFRFDDITY